MVPLLILVLALSTLLMGCGPGTESQAQSRAAPPKAAAVPPGPGTPFLKVDALHLTTEGKEGERHLLLMEDVGGRVYSQKPTFDLIAGVIRGRRFIPRATLATVNATCQVPLEGVQKTQSIRLIISPPGPPCPLLTMLAPSGPEADDSEGLMLRIHVKTATGYGLRWPNDKFSTYGLPWPTRTPEGDTINLYQLLWSEDVKQWLLVGAMRQYPTN